MFEALKKTFSSILGIGKKAKEEPKKEKKKAGKKAKAKKEKLAKVVETPEEETKIEEQIPEEEIKEEGAFSKAIKGITSIFSGKKEKTEEDKIKDFEEIKEDIKEERKEGFFSKLINRITTSKLSESEFNEMFSEFELTLLENNVALEVVDKIKESLSKELVGTKLKAKEAEQKVLSALKNSILSVLIEPPNLIEQIKSKSGVYTILFFGINGSGKTTTIAKLAHLLKKNGISSVMAAADTFRAASIEQLKTHGERVGVPVIAHDYGSDPAAVAFDAKKYATSNNIKVVLIDTAGRMYTKTNLMKEMEKIVRVSQPDLKIFVGESITGNDAIEQAKTFNETAGIDGIILSKADVDEKAGAILSVSHVTNKPIYYLGIGQSYGDLQPFSKSTVLKNLGLE